MNRVLLFALAALAPGFAQAELRYTLEPEPAAQSIRVSLTLSESKAKEEFRIPRWCPGFYFLLNYPQKLSDFRATDPDGTPLTANMTEPGVWVVDNPSGKPISVSYRVLGDDGGLGFFRVNVRPDTAFVNGPAAFVYPMGRKEERTTLTLKLPEGWDVATGMDRRADGVFTSGDYDELIDHPLQLGKFVRRKFDVMGTPFEAIFVTKGEEVRANIDETVTMLRKVSEPAIRMFGGVPFKRYVYIIHLAVGDFAGGLEHRASTVLAIPNTPQLGIESLAAHEFFHVWNVKHIRPAVLGPFDYTQKVRTANLWFAEGVTDYYAHLMVYRGGLHTTESLLEAISDEIASLERSRAARRYTLADASRLAWDNGGFGIGDMSFYTKGFVVGLILDAAIRTQTEGKRSLDDVMRLMFERHRLPKPGYAEDGILKAINEVSGKDMTALYQRLVFSTASVPYDLLAGIGLRWDAENSRLVKIPVPPSEAASRLEAWLQRP